MSSSGFRKLWSVPIVTAEWNTEYEERSADWWELFVDLIIVAAATNVADTLKEDMSWHGLVWFCIVFSLFFSGMNLYSQYTTRYLDTSLLHSFFLFLYLYGTAVMVVNANVEYARTFCVGMLIQRAAVCLMQGGVFVLLARAKKHASIECFILLTSMTAILIGRFVDTDRGYAVVLIFLAVWENFYYLFIVLFVRIKHSELVPINIDHYADRLGAMVMVVLGESIVSAIINYNKLSESQRTTEYYEAMALTLLLTYAVGLIYFSLQPPRDLHALRRHSYSGIGFLLLHMVLAISLLAMGVGIKFIIDAVINPDSEESYLSRDQVWLFFGSLGIALISMILIRVLHFWGRPSPHDPPLMKQIKSGWWGGFFILMWTPLLCGYFTLKASPDAVDPFTMLGLAVTCVFGIGIIETIITHILVSMGQDSVVPVAARSPRSIRATSYGSAGDGPMACLLSDDEENVPTIEDVNLN
mmetsp:Transcript_3014/g.5670  ORF Transcript_3014/g.5670 Transcript_3014/m.5670 type:complete len:470 (+) Transcript_3014:270-1679(+)